MGTLTKLWAARLEWEYWASNKGADPVTVAARLAAWAAYKAALEEDAGGN